MYNSPQSKESTSSCGEAQDTTTERRRSTKLCIFCEPNISIFFCARFFLLKTFEQVVGRMTLKVVERERDLIITSTSFFCFWRTRKLENQRRNLKPFEEENKLFYAN